VQSLGVATEKSANADSSPPKGSFTFGIVGNFGS